MTSKERVLTAFAGHRPDRVPINFLCEAGIKSRLMNHFGLNPGDQNGLLKILGVDFRHVSVPYSGRRLHQEIPGRIVWPDWGVRTRWIDHDSGGYWEYCDFPLKDAGEEEIALWPMPSPDDYDYKASAEACGKYAEFAVCCPSHTVGTPPDVINFTAWLRTMEQVLVDLATDDPAGLLLIERRANIQLEITYRTLEAAKGKIDYLWLSEDLGTQRGPIMSLQLFRKHIRPRIQKYVDLAKAFNLPVMIHSCGSSSWAFADFIDMGIHVVDTLQPEAKDMSPAYLKKTFGNHLAFHGCISTAGPVAYGSVEDVVDSVKETLEIMMPGGGYCLSPTHAIQDNSPVENVVALYEAARKHGQY